MIFALPVETASLPFASPVLCGTFSLVAVGGCADGCSSIRRLRDARDCTRTVGIGSTLLKGVFTHLRDGTPAGDGTPVGPGVTRAAR